MCLFFYFAHLFSLIIVIASSNKKLQLYEKHQNIHKVITKIKLFFFFYIFFTFLYLSQLNASNFCIFIWKRRNSILGKIYFDKYVMRMSPKTEKPLGNKKIRQNTKNHWKSIRVWCFPVFIYYNVVGYTLLQSKMCCIHLYPSQTWKQFVWTQQSNQQNGYYLFSQISFVRKGEKKTCTDVGHKTQFKIQFANII